MDSHVQQEKSAYALALQELGVEGPIESPTVAVTEDHVALTIDHQEGPNEPQNSTDIERRFLRSLLHAAEEPSPEYMQKQLEAASDPLEQASDSEIEDDGSKASRKDRAKKHRAELREKKLMLRRRRMMRQTEEAQDKEPAKVSPFNALPHFEYLEIAAPVEVDLPSDLNGFSLMDISTTQADAPPNPMQRDVSDDSSVSEGEDAHLAALRMFDRLSEHQNGEAKLRTLRPRFESDHLSPNLLSQPIPGLASDDPGSCSRRESALPHIENEYRSLILPPRDSIMGFVSDKTAAEFSSACVRSTNVAAHGWDNILCAYATCPIMEIHGEGVIIITVSWVSRLQASFNSLLQANFSKVTKTIPISREATRPRTCGKRTKRCCKEFLHLMKTRLYPGFGPGMSLHSSSFQLVRNRVRRMTRWLKIEI